MFVFHQGWEVSSSMLKWESRRLHDIYVVYSHSRNAIELEKQVYKVIIIPFITCCASFCRWLAWYLAPSAMWSTQNWRLASSYEHIDILVTSIWPLWQDLPSFSPPSSPYGHTHNVYTCRVCVSSSTCSPSLCHFPGVSPPACLPTAWHSWATSLLC